MTRPLFRISTLLVAAISLLGLLQVAHAYRSNSFTIYASGTPEGELEFSGWCDVGISNTTLLRIDLKSAAGIIDPLEVQGRKIDNCKLVIDSGEGEITLLLKKNGKKFFSETTSSSGKNIIYKTNTRQHGRRPMTIR